MKPGIAALWFACLLLPQSAAMALDNSASVKAATLLRTSSSWDGTPIEYPPGKAEITAMMIEVAPGAETGWHLHPVPSFAYLLEGDLEIRLKNGLIKRAGQALAEVVNTAHNGRNVGTVPVRLVVFYTGAEGRALTAKEGP